MQELFWDPEGGAYFNNQARSSCLAVVVGPGHWACVRSTVAGSDQCAARLVSLCCQTFGPRHTREAQLSGPRLPIANATLPILLSGLSRWKLKCEK